MCHSVFRETAVEILIVAQRIGVEIIPFAGIPNHLIQFFDILIAAFPDIQGVMVAFFDVFQNVSGERFADGLLIGRQVDAERETGFPPLESYIESLVPVSER